MSSQSVIKMVFQDGEMPETTPAHVKFTSRSWFGLKKTYKVVEQTDVTTKG